MKTVKICGALLLAVLLCGCAQTKPTETTAQIRLGIGNPSVSSIGVGLIVCTIKLIILTLIVGAIKVNKTTI